MIENNSTEAGTKGHRLGPEETPSRQAQGEGQKIRSFAPSGNPPTPRERVPPSAETPFRWSCRPTIWRRPCPHVPLPPIKHIKHPIASGPSLPPIVPAAESHYGKTLGTSVFSKVRTDFSKVLREFPEVLREFSEVLRVFSKVSTVFSDVTTAVSKTPTLHLGIRQTAEPGMGRCHTGRYPLVSPHGYTTSTRRNTRASLAAAVLPQPTSAPS